MKKSYYDILHVHGNSSAMTIEMIIGKIKKINIRIAHCHNTQKNSIVKKFLKIVFNKTYTNAFACGDLAGKNLFGKNDFYLMRNGIDTNKYRFNDSIRNNIRNELNISDKIVLGHIGRFNTQKNHTFLLDIFEKVACESDDYVLLLVGDGADFNKIKERIDNSKYKDRIILYGETNTPEILYLAMDLFVFPSLYEGLPLTLIEAQVSGLKCFISDTITKEVILSNQVKSLPINDSNLWKDEILSSKICEDREKFYTLNIEKINKYNIDKCVKELEEKYKSLV